jgi:adsorption protein B
MIVAAAQSGLRMWCCSRIYSWRFAALAPLRAVWGNAMNSAATVSAIQQFVAAKLGRRTVAWSKTEHTYPEHYGAGRARPLLGEVLVRMRCLSMGDLESALDTCPAGTRFGEHLLELEKISEDDLYRALSSQSGIPLGLPHAVNRRALRTLPAEAARRWRVLPYRMNVGQIHVVTADLPSPEMLRELSIFSSMEVRFRLVLPREFEALAREYLPVA